jgi:hypothetical protein
MFIAGLKVRKFISIRLRFDSSQLFFIAADLQSGSASIAIASYTTKEVFPAFLS